MDDNAMLHTLRVVIMSDVLDEKDPVIRYANLRTRVGALEQILEEIRAAGSDCVLEMHRGPNPMTIGEIAKELGVSRTRANQIMNRTRHPDLL